MILREYQNVLVEKARMARRSGQRRVLLTSATGSGKTVMAGAMIARSVELGDRVLVVAHRKELVDQFYTHLTQRLGLEVGIMRGSDERTDSQARVQVGTVQTLTRRDLPPADLVVVDEAHRIAGESYRRILAAYPRATVLGLTATPCRLDGQPLKEHFDVLVEGAPYSELIDRGAIAAPIVYAPANVPDCARVRKVAGDFHEGDLEKVMTRAHVIGDVVRTWMKHAQGRSTVCFAVGIEHSKKLARKFIAEGVRAAHLDGTTPEEEREQILVALEVGRLQVVSNVGVLCEGWDQPSAKCCIMARPTLSLTLWMQCAGRILRPWGELPPVILDHSGNVERHGLPHEDRAWSLEGKARRTSEVRYVTCAGCYAYVERMPCPLCGFSRPVEPRKVKERDGTLVRVDRPPVKERSSDPKRVLFDSEAEKARKKGFKPGYAAAKFKEAYGDWPPWAWSQSLKDEYAQDPHWQERVAKRTREREFWQDRQQAAEELRRDAEDSYEETETLEEEGAFDGL